MTTECPPRALHLKGSISQLQGAFRQVALEADACAKELTQILKQRLVTQKDEAAECIQMVRKLGEPIESLQVHLSSTLLPASSFVQCLLTFSEATASAG